MESIAREGKERKLPRGIMKMKKQAGIEEEAL